MNMKSVAGLILQVDDLERSKAFYSSLGFSFPKEVPGIAATAYLNRFWIELLLKDKVVLEGLTDDPGIAANGAGISVHISVDNVDEFYESVVSGGLKPAGKPKDYSWGNREFLLRDPDGYKLVFFTESD